MNLGDIKVKVGVDTRDLKQGLESAKASAQQFAQTLQGLSQPLAAASKAMQEAAASATSNAERSRQLTAASKELTAARARLAEIMGGEGQIAQAVAAKYSGLQNMQRAQLIEVKQQIAALELEAKAQQAAAAAAVKAQEAKILAAGKAALAQKAAADSAIAAAEREAAAEVKAALAAGQAAAAQQVAARSAGSALRFRERISLPGGASVSPGAGAGGAIAAGAALLAAGAIAQGFAQAVRANIEFNKSLADVATVSGASAQRMAELRGQVQQLAMETGKDTGELTKGLYQVESAFGDTADSAKILAINTRLAIGGVSTVEDALRVTSATTKAYGDTSAAAQKHVADLALETVKLGQTRLPELGAAMGKVTPLAAALKVSQQELFAVMATGTGVTGTASEVSTQFRGILQSLMAPTATMSVLFKRAGVTSGEALIQQRGFQGAVQLIAETAEASNTPLQKYISSIEGQTLALSLAGPQAARFTDRLKEMRNASGELERAYDKQANGVNKLGTAWDKLSQTVKVAQQNLAQQSAPYLEYLVSQTTALIQRLQHAGPMLSEIGKGIAGIAMGHQDWGETGPPRPGQRLTPEQVAALQLGPAGRLSKLTDRPYGPPLPAGFTPHPNVAPPAPTKEAIDAHNKIADALKRADFEAARAAAVRYHGELSLQTAALDLYGKALETLNAGQRKSAAAFLESEKAGQRDTDAVKAGEDAAKRRSKAEEDAARKRAQQLADYRAFLREQEVATRVAQDQPGAGLAAFRMDHPAFSAAQAKTAYNAEQWRKNQEALNEQARAQERADQALRATMQDELQQAQIEQMSAAAKRKYGEINRESLALESQWHDHYDNLSDAQKEVISQIWLLLKAKQADGLQDHIRQYQAQQAIKDTQTRADATEKEKDALLDLAKAMEKRRREAEQVKEKAFDQGLQQYSEQLKQEAARRHQQLNAIADQTSGIFESAFHDAYERGPAQFFRSVVQGVERMFQDIAAKYLASQLTNLIFGKPNFQTGDRNLGSLGGVVGSFLGSLGGGGDIAAGSLQNMFSLQSAPSRGGTVAPGVMAPARLAAAGAGSGPAPVQITMHVHGVTDANSFRANKGAIQGDLYRAAQKAVRRDG